MDDISAEAIKEVADQALSGKEGGYIMSAPGKAGNFLSVKVRHSQRLAAGLSPRVHLWR